VFSLSLTSPSPPVPNSHSAPWGPSSFVPPLSPIPIPSYFLSPSLSLKLIGISEEVGFTVGKAKKLWKSQKKELSLKYIEMAIRCYALGIQLISFGKVSDWSEGT
jgi:hypothetical protein